jgi:hypothetical protein
MQRVVFRFLFGSRNKKDETMQEVCAYITNNSWTPPITPLPYILGNKMCITTTTRYMDDGSAYFSLCINMIWADANPHLDDHFKENYKDYYSGQVVYTRVPKYGRVNISQPQN